MATWSRSSPPCASRGRTAAVWWRHWTLNSPPWRLSCHENRIIPTIAELLSCHDCVKHHPHTVSLSFCCTGARQCCSNQRKTCHSNNTMYYSSHSALLLWLRVCFIPSPYLWKMFKSLHQLIIGTSMVPLYLTLGWHVISIVYAYISA